MTMTQKTETDEMDTYGHATVESAVSCVRSLLSLLCQVTPLFSTIIMYSLRQLMIVTKMALATKIGLILRLITFAMVAMPGSSQEQSAAYLRCQKSGCPTANNAEDTALIGSGSPFVKVFPIIISWVIIFFILRVAAHFLCRLFLILCNNIGMAMEHCYNSFFRSQRRLGNVLSLASRSRTPKSSFDSLTDLVDDDSTSASYSSATSSEYTTSSDDSLSVMVENSSVMECQPGAGFMSSSPLHSSAGRSYKSESAATGHQSIARGGEEAIVSKFLAYITESGPKDEAEHKQSYPQREIMYDRRNGKRRPTVTFDLSHDKNDHEGRRRQRRRHTMDSMFRASYPPTLAAYQSKTTRRSEGSNHTQSLVVTSHKSLQLDEVAPVAVKVKGQDPPENIGNR